MIEITCVELRTNAGAKKPFQTTGRQTFLIAGCHERGACIIDPSAEIAYDAAVPAE